jgi:hypothetical protein
LLLPVLGEQAGRPDVVAVDDQAVVDRRRAVAAGAVVGTPDPAVVEQDAVAVNLPARRRHPSRRSADAHEQVGQRCLVRHVTVPSASTGSSDLHEGRLRVPCRPR